MKNTEKKERRAAQIAKKNERIKEQASELIMQSDTRMLIDGRPYELVKNYRDGFQVEKLQERFSHVLTKYDYIVGDWGYDQLRLRGFYRHGSKFGSSTQSIDLLEDYLTEYCNFGCAYFVLHNLDVQVPKMPRHRRRQGSNIRCRVNKRQPSKGYAIHRREKSTPSSPRNGSRPENGRRHFTIQQKKHKRG
ncbi:YutD family protein [Ligilactobacillus sp. LYQ60]|uniref:YutD family protein n=1 Tax=unclassified Ligilactobacillus TaxID=2767920 RepID=UPI003851F837